MNLKEQIAALKSQLAALKSRIEADDADAITEGEKLAADIAAKEAQLAKAEAKAALLKSIGGTDTDNTKSNDPMSLSERIKAAGFANLKVNRGTAAVEIKAATDTVVGTQVQTLSERMPSDRNRNRIADAITPEPISGNAIKYFRIGATEGSAGKVAEGAKKPQVHPVYEAITAPLAKHAAYFKETDELLEDLPRLEAVMTGRLVKAVEQAEDADIVADILATSGIGAVTGGISFDNLLKAKSQVSNDAKVTADVLVINPTDLLTLLLAKDGDQRYLMGGPAYAYGGERYTEYLPIWGMRVIASTGITAGTALVGAFGDPDAITLAKKDGEGVRAEATNSNEDDFIHDIVCIRGEVHSTPALRKPAAFVSVST